MKKYGFIMMLIAAAAVFSVQDARPASVVVLSWKLEAPLTLVIVAAMLIGMLAGGLIAYRPDTRTKEKGKEPEAAKREEKS
jgi:uncharacterized integral membrane protein